MDVDILSQLLAMDVSARTTMKDAAKCDKRNEWQNSANLKNAERILRSLDSPKSMLGSERLYSDIATERLQCASYRRVCFRTSVRSFEKRSIDVLDYVVEA